METPETRGATAVGFPTRGRAVTRPRAGPRCATEVGRRPDTPRSATRRRAPRFRFLSGAVLARFATGRADFVPRVFEDFVIDFFLAAAFLTADFFFAAFFALALFFLRVVVI